MQLIGGRRLEPLATTMSDAERDKARSEIRNLLDLMSTFAPMVERAVGGDAAGYRTIARAMNMRTPRSQAFMLLAWLALRQDPEPPRGSAARSRPPAAGARCGRARAAIPRAGTRGAGTCLPAQQRGARIYAATLMRAHAGAPRSARVSNEHREQVDSFFRQHPEVEQLMSTAGNSE